MSVFFELQDMLFDDAAGRARDGRSCCSCAAAVEKTCFQCDFTETACVRDLGVEIQEGGSQYHDAGASSSKNPQPKYM